MDYYKMIAENIKAEHVRISIKGDSGKVFLSPGSLLGTDQVVSVGIALAETKPAIKELGLNPNFYTIELPVNNRDDVFWDAVHAEILHGDNGIEKDDVEEDAAYFVDLVCKFVCSWRIKWDRPEDPRIETYDRRAYDNMARFLI